MHFTIWKQQTIVVIRAALMLLFLGSSGYSQTGDDTIPGLFDVNTFRITILDAVFVTELKGTNATFNETAPEKYRGMILSLRITKPAKTPLTLYAQDLSLHYRREADKFDVAKCNGLSSFSTSQDVDRPMNLYRTGLGSVATGLATLKASVVYVDAFFQFMEPETRELHLLVAQPVGSSYVTKGWTK